MRYSLSVVTVGDKPVIAPFSIKILSVLWKSVILSPCQRTLFIFFLNCASCALTRNPFFYPLFLLFVSFINLIHLTLRSSLALCGSRKTVTYVIASVWMLLCDCVCVSLCLYLFVHLSVFLCLYVCFSLRVSLCLSLYLPVSMPKFTTCISTVACKDLRMTETNSYEIPIWVPPSGP